MLRNLGEFLSLLRREGELKEIKVPVSSDLEIAEIHRRVIAQGGPALFFKNVVGAKFPLVTNLFGSKKRIELAFGEKPGQFIKRLARLPQTLMPPSLKNIWSEREILLDLLKVGIKRTRTAPVLRHQYAPAKLSWLPALKTWQLDGGKFITLPLVYTEHPITHVPNLGMYRLHIYDDTRTGFHCQIGKGGGFHLAQARKLNQDLPVNVFVGGPPALILSAIAPLPENVPELLLASLIQDSRLETCSHPYGPLPLISQAEFAFVGEVSRSEVRPEGPFGDHYGYYSLAHEYPVFTCKAMLHRADAVFPATVVGKPRQEDFFLGDYLQELLSPLFPLVMPSVRDLWSYGETGYHSLAAAIVEQRYKRESMVAAFRILGEGQLSLTKFLLVADRPMDLRDFKAVLSYILERADLRTDFYIFSNLSMDTLDYTGPKVNEGSKAVLLGVGEKIRDLPGTFVGSLPSWIKKVQVYIPGCLVLEVAQFSAELCAEFSKLEATRAWPLIVVVDNVTKTCASTQDFLWTVFTRFEPGADVYAADKHIVRNHISYFPPIVIDARMKPSYPEELTCDIKTGQLVEQRWKQYWS